MLNKNLRSITLLLLVWTVWLAGTVDAQTFQAGPSVVDSAGQEETAPVFSPNGDEIQDTVVIGFVANGNFGDWRIIIDTHGTGGIGGPDGVFDPDNDWTAFGSVNNLVTSIRRPWDGAARAGESTMVPDGTYDVRVELDYVQNSNLLSTDAGYEAWIGSQNNKQITVDTKQPGLTAQFTADAFSPNGDGVLDEATLEYWVQDATTILTAELVLQGRAATPAIQLSGRAPAKNSYSWNGKDSLGVLMPEGDQALTLRIEDAGGNVREMNLNVQIDIQKPEIQISAPAGTTTRDAVQAVSVVADPGNGSAIDPNSVSITLKNAAGAVAARSITFDTATNVLTLTPQAPLAGNAANGAYTVDVALADKAGNSVSATFEFTYDTQAPSVVSATSVTGTLLSIAKPVTLEATDTITLALSELGGSGIDFASPQITLRNPSGGSVPVTVSNPSSTSIAVSYAGLQVIGNYSLDIANLADLAGNVAATVTYPFAYGVVRVPGVVSITPASGSAVDQLAEVAAQLLDNSGSGIDIETSSLRVLKSDGTVLDGTVTRSGDTLTWRAASSLPRDGTADGTYTIEVTAVDNVGGETTETATVTYDSLAPIVTASTPTALALVQTLNGVTVTLSDGTGSGVDFGATQVQLLSPAGSPISGVLRNNGVDSISLQFDARATDGSEDGAYTIAVTAADRAGNVGSTTNLQFGYLTALDRIVNVSPAYDSVVNQLSEITVQLVDQSSSLLNIAALSVSVLDSDGKTVAASTQMQDGQLRWQPAASLPRDGSADGDYTVNIAVTTTAGDQMPDSGTIRYDTQAPVVAGNTPSADKRVEALSQVIVTLTDQSSGVDFTATQVQLLNPAGAPVSATQTDNGTDTVTLWFAALATDGSEDGRYTIQVTPADRAGNVGGTTNIRFDYATQLPEVAALSPAAGSLVNQLNQVTAQLAAPTGTEIDMTASGLRVLDSTGAVVAGDLVRSGNTLMWQIRAPLARDGSADGDYTVEVTVLDKAGGSWFETATVSYDSQAPTVVSSTPAALGVVEVAFSSVTVTLSDTGSGVDFGATQVQLLIPTGAPVAATQSSNGVDLITLRFDSPATDGSEDGRYTIAVTPADRAGNVAATTNLRFDYVTRPPEVTQVSIAEASVVNTFTQVQIILEEFSGQGIDFSRSTIRLLDADGNPVPGRVTNDKVATLTYQPTAALATDGSADGDYTIEITAVNKVGIESVVSVPFMLDTLPPTLTSVDPASGSRVSAADVTLTLVVADATSGVDFAASTVQLTGPAGAVPVQVHANGVDMITVSPGPLSETGKYTLQIDLADLAGNRSLALQSNFTYSVKPPRVLTTAPADRSAVNALGEIRITVQDDSGKGIDVTATAAALQVLNPQGVTLDGDVTADGDMLVFTPVVALTTDGADDGNYTVRAQPIDNMGNTGLERRFSFTYDTQVPEILSLTDVDFTRSVSLVNGQIRRIEAQVQDASSEISFAASSVRLLNDAGDEVAGIQGDNDSNLIWWELASALPRGGSADGAYTVAVKITDKAGNVADKRYALIYDTQPPSVAANTPTDGTLVQDTLSVVTVQLQDALSGIDLLNSTLELSGPAGAVGANQSDNGVDTLALHFNALKTDGSDDGTYRLEITPADLAGNVLQNPVVYEFFYVTQAPELVSSTPERLGYVTALAEVSVQIQDHSGKGIDFDASSLAVIAPDGTTELAGQQTDDQVGTFRLTLDQPLPTDGTQDGQYTLHATAVDKAGATATYDVPFQVDTVVPHLVSVTPASLAQLTESIDQATAVLSDQNETTGAAGSGIDFQQTSVSLAAPDGSTINGNVQANGVDTLVLSFPPITASGNYQLRVIPADRAGNVSNTPITFWFTLTVNPPVVVEVQVAGAQGDYTSTLTEIKARLKDRSQAGLNLTPAGSTIRVTTAQGALIDGEQRAEGDTLRWSPVVPLATDGSQDGTYTITATPVDNGNRTGQSRVQSIIYDTQAPRVMSISPGDVTTALTHVGPQLSRLEATIADEGPSGLLVEDQRVTLMRNGQAVAGTRSDDGNSRVIWTLQTPLPADGNSDGEYQFQVEVSDRAGNTDTFTHTLVYDTSAPELVSTTPADGDVISGNIRSVSVQLSDAAPGRIDFGASQITLLAPDGSAIAGTPTNNGVDTATLQFDGLEDDGTYTLQIIAIDQAGNGVNRPLLTEFFYSTSVPVVLETTPVTQPVEDAYAHDSLDKVTAKLRETNNGGINFTPIGSTIRLYDPNGNLVSGNQSDNGVDLISWDLAKPLETDGSDDGAYVIAVVPANAAGRHGDEVRFTFTYDTQVPEVDLDTLQLKMVETGTLNSLNEIQVVVTDPEPASGLDWKNIDDSWIQLISPDGKPVPGRVSSDKQQMLILRIDAPLASDGSQDGEYTVPIAPVDKAGNVTDAIEYSFVYDTDPPEIDVASLLLDSKPIQIDTEADDFPTATNAQSDLLLEAKLADAGLGVDLALSSIEVFSPQGNPVNGTSQQNGVDTIQYRSGAIGPEGIYRVTITAVGLDREDLGIRPTSSLSTSFLLERTKPVGQLTDSGVKSNYEDEEVTLRGTAQDPAGQDGVPASGVALVEIGAEAPDGTTEWIPTIDDSETDQEPWSKWYLDFLPSKSGQYDLSVRVTDNAGNSEVFKGVTLDFSVSLAFRGGVYVWPNPVSRGLGDTAHISNDLNVAQGQTVDLTLFIYTVAGDLASEISFPNRGPGRDDQTVFWDLTNSASGAPVASGVYIFRLEASDGTNTANQVGRILVVR